MLLNHEIRKISIFFFSFIGLFIVTKYIIIDPGLKNIPTYHSSDDLKLEYGRVGLLLEQNEFSLFWGSTDNENLQDIFYRLSYLIDKKSKIVGVDILLRPEIFAQKKFSGPHLSRVIPYYPLNEIVKRVFKNGISYEFIINFFKYKVGVPFRSSREIGMIIKNKVQQKNKFPYFGRKVSHISNPNSHIGNVHYLWLIIEKLINNEIPIKLSTRSNFTFPAEVDISKILLKIKRIYKDKVIINN
jgi:hypothetical protein